MCSMIHTGLRPAANTDVTHKRSEVTIVNGACFLTQMIFSYLDLFSSVFILSLNYFLKGPLYSGSLSSLFLFFLITGMKQIQVRTMIRTLNITR